MEAKKDKGDDASDEDINNEIDYDSDEDGCVRIDDIYIPPPPKHFTAESQNGPRLILNKIVNYNFKSYAGEIVVGPFHKCFSAIVGPNGSGKSNVIDSMLFVFGYRANKIRSKKVSFLIHNSKEHPNINSCKVSVHFLSIIDKEGENFEVVPNSEFVISRTAFKDNTNFYELNEKRVQFKQIAKLLRSYGVDLDHNRFLILQGEVEQISLMKPKGQTEGDTGMLEFLEDIIGTSRFKEPLDKLYGRVELLSENRVEKLNRLRIAEKEKKDLEEPMKEAVEYLKIENSIIHLQHQLYQLKKYETSKNLKEEEEKCKELENDLDALKEEMQKVKDEREEKQKIMKEKMKKWDAIQRNKDEKSTKLDALQKKDEALHAEMVEQNKLRKKCMESIKSEKAKLEGLLKAPEKHTKDIEECENLNAKNEAQREQEEATLATLMSKFEEKARPLIEKRSKLETELMSKKQEVDEAKSKHSLAKKKLDIYTSNEQTEKSKLEQIQQSLKTDLETLKQRKEQLASLIPKIAPTEKSLKQSQKELQEIQTKEATLRERLNSKREEYDQQKCAINTSRSRNRVLNALMEQKRLGHLPGILGRLGDLGAIDAKYDVAISTACGALDNIIVDTVDTAQKCINFLRQNNIGRGSFIPLEKQQRFKDQCKQRIKTPENVLRLFDLIKVDNQDVLVAFYYALQNTLVADNLDQATRIAYGAQRFRVVTLKGELIELSGTMSGGGRTVLRGRMGQSIARSEPSAVDIEKLNSEMNKIFEECEKLKAAQVPLEEQISTLSSSLQQMQNDRSKFESEIQAINYLLPSLRQQLKQQEKIAAEAVSDPKKVKSMSAQVKEALVELERAEEASASIEQEVKRLNDEIDKVSGGKIKEIQKSISNLTKAIDKAKAEVYRLRVAIKAAERNARNTEQLIKNDESSVKRYEDRLRTINQERKDIEDVAIELNQAILELNEQLEERDEMVGSLREEINATQSRESKMKHMKVELDHKFSEENKILKELRSRIPEIEHKITAMNLHKIPNEDVEELKVLNEEEVEALVEKNLPAKLQRAKERLPQKTPNMQLIREYQEKDELYLKRATELDVITTQRNKIRDLYDMVRRKRSSEFLCGFDIITKKLKEMYQMITLGGDAELELVDSIDPFSEGIVFSVRPPKKSWKNINNLSGGEKTLSSLALVFALHHYKPTPLYFMDEIDAALDFKNVSIVGHYIKERTKNAQFIIISLRSNMFELADYMVGIYKTFNCTKSACLDLSLFYKNNNIQRPAQETCSQPVPSTTTNNHSPQHQNVLTCPPSIPHGKKQEEVTACKRSMENLVQPADNSDKQMTQEVQQEVLSADIVQENTAKHKRSSLGYKRTSLSSSLSDESQVNSSIVNSDSETDRRRSKRRRKDVTMK